MGYLQDLQRTITRPTLDAEVSGKLSVFRGLDFSCVNIHTAEVLHEALKGRMVSYTPPDTPFFRPPEAIEISMVSVSSYPMLGVSYKIEARTPSESFNGDFVYTFRLLPAELYYFITGSLITTDLFTLKLLHQ